MLLLSVFGIAFKWYNVNRSKDSQDSTATYRTVKEATPWEFPENHKSTILQKMVEETSLDGYFNLTSDIFLKSVPQQC